ncbi:uncharacterized protein LOC106175407 isoform X1 [Lingula anatina]|uniref:Uncharacterized protein LOC106175407 isoform X1 n=1 Tax=Lingula anatina TaxID=7574 RepID=A0A1S3JR76_LINAN|nr:uncharacterized protein LOC106175407 isoform X1 [Lingula anatina]XP_013412840.1 uncharacterized protein LOC106175407 isoform X1 [Lingula anatina]XP_013412841.1 uncharacterized protein LOC106175407 isoform X1 [Lingula anatina]XP_013412842.1 uncharacterized protein LOC106175407 isoform X1 [Lingula anatina]XP_013412843.1 uncharacterized protein LOC106175407 isoform X1 [Lingula anatina]XP_023930457.1 uncharacterized protein LOC106175407 isoform X1 [Lingula anatina]|eukprot:XP_013412839.1 uncharacterized protein LOC106175407 isoform X1 [Lingula anatina]
MNVGQITPIKPAVNVHRMTYDSENPSLPTTRRDSMLRTLKEDLWTKYKSTREIGKMHRSQGKMGNLRVHKSVADFRQIKGKNNVEEGTKSLSTRRSFPSNLHKIVEMKPATCYISKRTKDMKETLQKMGACASRQNSRQRLLVNSLSASITSRQENAISMNDDVVSKRKQFVQKLSRLKQMGSSTSSESELASDGSPSDNAGLGMLKMAGVLKRKLTLKKLGLSAAKPSPKPPRSFRRLARFVVIFFRVWRLHSFKIRTTVQALTTSTGSNARDVDLLFDKSIFKANKEMRLSGETIRILRKRPVQRTEEELHNVKVALMNYPSISEFPVQMQEMIVRKAWYDTIDVERVIVREGQRPLYFYFILSGTVVKKVMDDERKQSRTLAFLSRGESFGDQDIIEQRPRDCTIIAMETTELMCMSAKDFVEIFQSGGLKDVNDPFFQSVSCLQGWPLHLLANNPKKAVLRFFKRGMVLVKDSSSSDWLYIVKTGSCKVLKKLKKAQPKLKVRRPKVKIPKAENLMPVKQNINPRIPHTDLLDSWLQHEVDKVTASQTNQRGFYRYDEPEINVGTLSTYRRPSELSVVRENSLIPQLPPPQISKGKVGGTSVTAEHNITPGGERPVNTQLDTPCHDTLDVENVSHASLAGRQLTGDSLSHADSCSPALSSASKKMDRILPKGPFLTKINKPPRNGPSSPNTTDQAAEQAEAVDEANVEAKTDFDGEQPMKKVKFTEILPKHRNTHSDYGARPKDKEDPAMFVTVKTLTKGTVFGLTEFIYGKQTSLSLVSNGAECIMIEKKFFSEHAPQALMNRLREEIFPFPGDEELQQGLQTRVSWEAHKRAAFSQTIRAIQMKKTNVQDTRMRMTTKHISEQQTFTF